MKLVLFDLDETLIEGDSVKLWLEFCVREGALDEGFLKKAEFYQRQYHANSLDMDEFMSFFLQSVKNSSVEEIKSRADTFVKTQIKPYPKALSLLSSLQNHRRIIVSATADFLVERIAKMFGVEESIAIQTERIDGKFSGRSLGIHSFREGKVRRLRQYLGEEYEKWMENSTFYSDSINDLALLCEVKEPIVCNGDAQLLGIAKERGWRCVDFRD